MAIKAFAAGLGQSVDATGEVKIIEAHLAAGSAAASAVIYSNGTPVVYLAAIATGNDSYAPGISPGISVAGMQAPVTLDVVGTGAHLTLQW